MRNLSIKWKLYIMILFIFIPMLVFQLFQINSAFERNIDIELKSNQDFAEAVSTSFINYLERVWDAELAMGNSIYIKNIVNNDDIGNYMKSVVENQPCIRNYSCIDLSTLKIVSSSNSKAIGISVADREYIKRILNGENKVVSDLIKSRVDNKPVIVVARAIKIENKLKGIIICSLNVEEINKVLPPNRASEYSYFGLIDSQGIFVYRNGIPDIASKMISDKVSTSTVHALNGEIFNARKEKSPLTGINMITAELPIKQIGWAAYGNSSYDEFLYRAFMNIRIQLVVLVLIVIVAVLVCAIVVRQILDPIKILKASVLEMSKGNLNTRTNIKGNDEIALAAQAFDQMVASIEEYDSLKTQFFSNISHEFKTPLNIILSSIQLLESLKRCAPNRESDRNELKYILMMKQNSYRLLRLINNLIDITRIDSGFFKYNFSNNNIVSVIEDITQSVANYAESKGINIIFDTDVEEKIMGCDPDKLERIILNLLSNAIKFTPSGGSIFVSVFDKKDKVAISVKDTGIGIPKDKINIIFDRFRQVDTSLHRVCEGSGIGLSLVKALVEGCKGNIYAQSEEGKGTEIIVEFPVFQVEEDHNLNEIINQNTMDKVQKINIEFSDIYN